MHYLVHDFSKHGKVFATLQEANAYCNDCMRQSRKVTHVYDMDSTKDNK